MRYRTKKQLLEACKRFKVTKRHGKDVAFICRCIHHSKSDTRKGQKYWRLIYFPKWVVIGGRYGQWNEINIKEKL
jgi:hypothetical protein